MLTSPSNSTVDVPLDAKLTWQAVTDPNGDAVVYDVYFDTDATPVAIVGADPIATNFSPTLLANTPTTGKWLQKMIMAESARAQSGALRILTILLTMSF